MSVFFPDQLECLPGAVADATACTEAVLKPDFAAFGALGLGLVSGLGTFSVAFVALLATRLCHRPRCKPSESAALGAELCGGLQGEDTPFPEVSVLEQFLGQAQLHPKAEVARTVGVVSRSFSRQDLEAAARSLAQLLQSGNVERENQGQSSLVAIFLEPGPRQVAAILGIWLAGKAWTPFDRQSPFHRVAEMLQLVKPFGVVCDETAFLDSHDAPHDSYDSLRVVCADPKDPRLVWTVWTDRSEALKPEPELKLLQLAEVAEAESVAQVIYTSGSTGMPKGVVYSHRRLAHSSHFFGELCAVSSGTKCLQRTAMIWSVFRHEIYPVLCKGGTIIFPQHAQGSFGKGDQPLHMAKVIESEAINLFVATPTVLELVLDASAALSSSALRSLQHVVCMGEPLPWRLAKSFYDKAPFTTKLLNFYGSTETENTTFEVPKPTTELWTTVAMDSFVPAGHPQPQTSVYLLDPSSTEEVTSGEICFGGVISTGYWNRPELTTQRFIEHPTHGRLYRTGDLGTWRKLSGTPVLQVLGRLDRQVKIRGARVELEEVEARVQEITLRNNGTESAVVAACGVDNHKVLVAVLGPVSIDAVRQDCEQRLPAFMVPSLFLQVAQLPRLANQKADLRAIEKLAEEGLQKLRASGTSGTSVEKVEMFTDSLGMMRRLTRAHMQEMQWLQNQLAFWTLVGLLGHFQLFDGAHGGDVAQRIQNSFGHNKDIVAFMMLLGVSDSREPPVLGVRDLLVLSVALLMTSLGPWLLSPSYGPLHHVFYSFSAMCSTYGLPWLRVRHDWFLYHYLFARLCLVGLTKVSAKYRGLCGAWQAVLVLCMACLIPDDVLWLWIPLEYRRSAWTRSAAIMTKGIRMCCFFLTGCYLLAFHTMKAMRAERNERNEALKESRSQGFHGLLRYAKRLKTEAAAARAWHEPSFAAVCGCGAGAFTVFLVLSVLTSQVPLGELGDFGGNVYQHGWKAIYVEGENLYTVSHAVSWHYMTHPSLFLYVIVYIGEMLLLVVPFFAVALMMACWQLCNCWHFKTMGSVCFGTYVLHPYHMVAPWTAWFQRPILSRITSGSFSLSANVLIVLLWNVFFCILFAQTAGAYFHNLLVAGTRKLSQVGKSCQGDGPPQANDAWVGSYASYGSSGRSQGP